jgi:hypothetical protein
VKGRVKLKTQNSKRKTLASARMQGGDARTVGTGTAPEVGAVPVAPRVGGVGMALGVGGALWVG